MNNPVVVCPIYWETSFCYLKPPQCGQTPTSWILELWCSPVNGFSRNWGYSLSWFGLWAVLAGDETRASFFCLVHGRVGRSSSDEGWGKTPSPDGGDLGKYTNKAGMPVSCGLPGERAQEMSHDRGQAKYTDNSCLHSMGP